MLSSKIAGLLVVFISITLQGCSFTKKKQEPRVQMFPKEDTIYVAKLFIKMDESFEETVLQTFAGTPYNTTGKFLNKVFDQVNAVFISQFGLKFVYSWEGAKDSERDEYPFLFDKANEKRLGICEQDQFSSKEELDKLIDARLQKFKNWANKGKSNTTGAVLLFSGCSYTMEFLTEAQATENVPNWLQKFATSLEGKLGRTHGSSTMGLAHLGYFCKPKDNTGLVSLRRLYFKSLEKFTITLIHEVGHLLGAPHVGVDDPKVSLGIMDYDGGYYKGLPQFYNGPDTIKSMQEVFKKSREGKGNERCWDSESQCPAKCVPHLGDGQCSEDPDCKSEVCHYDGYDCNDDGSQVCAIGCRKTWVKDGVCDAACFQNQSSCGKEEAKDCDCSKLHIIKKCMATSGLKDRSKCLARCGSNFLGNKFKKFRANRAEDLDPWRERVPEFFREKLGWWISGAVALVLAIIIIACCVRCKKRKRKNKDRESESRNLTESRRRAERQNRQEERV